MSDKVGIVYNDPVPGRLHGLGESGAVLGVLDAVSAVGSALATLGYEVVTLPLKPPLAEAEVLVAGLRVDVVVNLFEGFDGIPGSEAALAGVLERAGACFTGSPSRAIALSSNKSEAKRVLRSNGVPTPDWQIMSPDDAAEFRLTFPCIVKPLGEHASHGISADSVVGDTGALARRVEFVYRSYGCPSLVEEFVSGREFTALVMGNDWPTVFPIEEMLFALPEGRPRILTYAAKWVPDDEYFTGTKGKCPADVPAALRERMESVALQSFAALGCRGYARVDMRQAEGGELFVLEVNPNPDISSAGGARLQAEAAGKDYVTFIGEILCLAREGFRRPMGEAVSKAPAC